MHSEMTPTSSSPATHADAAPPPPPESDRSHLSYAPPPTSPEAPALSQNSPSSQPSHSHPSCSCQPSHLTAPLIPLFHQSDNPFPLSALAALLGCTRSTIRHFADRLGFRYTVRRIGPRHKRTACLTPDQANAIAAEVERESATYSSSSSSPSPAESPLGAPPINPIIHQPNNPPAAGRFYLLQLEPHHDPGRFKLGFSSDLESRFDDLRTVVPLARLIATWPAQRNWERIAIISTTQNAEQLSQEVFRTKNLAEVVAAADRFFAVMPKLPHLGPWVTHASRVSPLGGPPGRTPESTQTDSSVAHASRVSPLPVPPSDTPDPALDSDFTAKTPLPSTSTSNAPPPADSPPPEEARTTCDNVLPLKVGMARRAVPDFGRGQAAGGAEPDVATPAPAESPP